MKIGFALEYSLGHVTHAQNLKQYLAQDESIDPVYVDIPFDSTPMPSLLRPAFKDNWSVRASLAAARGLSPRLEGMSSCLFHTQVTSLFAGRIMRRVPSVVSLDATPLQYDSLGDFYGHKSGSPLVERLKYGMNCRAFRRAAHLVTWSQWAKDSLARDYGVEPECVTVIPPGIDLLAWGVDRSGRGRESGTTYLFVGADFERKGGPALLEAFRAVRTAHASARLLVVTKSTGREIAGDGVEVFRDRKPNTPELRDLYARADVFAFPTRGDCLPLAVMEALASGLPVIATAVGALGEAVTDGRCGRVVEPGRSDALASAMAEFARDANLTRAMGSAAVSRAEERFDADKNYRRLIAILKNIR